MQKAIALQSLIGERGKQRKPLERVYRMLFNPELYLVAYGKLYRNNGATTPGSDGESVDGMSMAKINAIIDDLRHERYRWKPARRIYIPKKNGKMRPLSIPSWSDKLVQETMRMILSAYYEPQFSDHSHGFREGNSPSDALREIRIAWKGTNWFIEGDIKGCFDNVDHQKLLEILARDIHDNRFIRLVKHMLEAGYMEDWQYNKTYSGTPQGGVVSPILANVYMNELDQYITETLLPKWNKGKKKAYNPEYQKLAYRAEYLRKAGRKEEAETARKEMQRLPSVKVDDEKYRRLRYVRYADDFLMGLAGPKEEAEEIKEEIRAFLQDTLKLELSQEKTLITHARTERARFLGYDVHIIHADDQVSRKSGTTAHRRRNINGHVALSVPLEIMEEKARKYKKNDKAIHRSQALNDSDITTIATFQSEYRGFVNYYAMAQNLCKLHKLKWVMEVALVKTLAYKHKTSARKVWTKYKAEQEVGGRKYKILKAEMQRNGKKPLVAVWGGIPLRWKADTTLVDRERKIWNGRTELVQRMLADECEYCGSTENTEVHHIHRVVAQKERGKIPDWLKIMRARNRKTMVLCHECHVDITFGRPIRNAPSSKGFMWTGKKEKHLSTLLESRMHRISARPVRRGGVGKVSSETIGNSPAPYPA